MKVGFVLWCINIRWWFLVEFRSVNTSRHVEHDCFLSLLRHKITTNSVLRNLLSTSPLFRPLKSPQRHRAILPSAVQVHLNRHAPTHTAYHPKRQQRRRSIALHWGRGTLHRKGSGYVETQLHRSRTFLRLWTPRFSTLVVKVGISLVLNLTLVMKRRKQQNILCGSELK